LSSLDPHKSGVGRPQTSRSADTAAHIDLDRVVSSNFLGVGTEWSAYPWWDLSDERWHRVLARVEYMQLPLTRVMQSAFYYWRGFEDSGEPVYNFDSTFELKFYRLLDWCETHGTTVIIGEWGAPVSAEGLTLANDDPRWARLIGDFLHHLVDVKRYSCIKYYNLINEPHGWWSTIAGRFPEWKQAMTNLASELRTRHLDRRISLVAPDADDEWTDKTIADPELREITGVYDEHWYVTGEEVALGRVEDRCRNRVRRISECDPRKRFLLGELGIVDGKTEDDKQPNVYEFWYGLSMADAAVQLIRGGCAGFIAWYLDDAMHFLGDEKVILHDGGKLPHDAYERRKVWGLWNSLGGLYGHPEDEQLRPWFYTWSLLSRCFPPGCDVVETSVEGKEGVRMAAARFNSGGQTHFSFALVSRVAGPCVVRISTSGVDERIDLDIYEYFDLDGDNRVDAWPTTMDDEGRDLFPQPVRRIPNADIIRGVDFDVPGAGVIFATSLKSEDGVR
jgi:hypothetical protein